ncbi:MAG: hypothetical protein ACREMF_08710 [Gemmatimonadales bacterium]
MAAQGVLSEFSYDNLRVSGIQLDVGSLASRDLRGALVGGVRLDAGYFAPRVRMLLGVSYARSEFDQRAVARFNRTLLALVNDPDSNATIDVGRVFLADVTADLDLLYMFNEGPAVTTALGLGVGVHVRNGSGRAIDRTFLEDALDGISPALNGIVGVAVALTPAWRLTGELRGNLLSDFSTASARVGFMYRFPAGRGGR